MSFRDMVKADMRKIFLNCGEFGEFCTIVYDGVRYAHVPVVMANIKEKDRRVLVSDHVQGLYMATCTLHCAIDDLGGVLPEKGMRFQVQEEGKDFFREYRIAKSMVELGMIRLELEAVDE